MPHYYFHLRTDGNLVRDEDGEDLQNLETARYEAIEAAREIMSEEVLKGKAPSNGRQFEIADEAGETVLTLRFAEAVSR
jgi:hypothetical protein